MKTKTKSRTAVPISALAFSLILTVSASAGGDPIGSLSEKDEAAAYRYLTDSRNLSDPSYAYTLRSYLRGTSKKTSARLYSEGAPLLKEVARKRANEASIARSRLEKSDPLIETYEWRSKDGIHSYRVGPGPFSLSENQGKYEALVHRADHFSALYESELSGSKTIAPVVDIYGFRSPEKAKRLMAKFAESRGLDEFFSEIVSPVFLGKPGNSGDVDGRMRTVADLLIEKLRGSNGKRGMKIGLETLEKYFRSTFSNGNFDGVQLVFETLESIPGRDSERMARKLAAYSVTEAESFGYVGDRFVKSELHPRLMKTILPHLDLDNPDLWDRTQLFFERKTSSNPIDDLYAAEEFMRRFRTDLEILLGAPKKIRDRLMRKVLVPFQLKLGREVIGFSKPRENREVEAILNDHPFFRKFIREARMTDPWAIERNTGEVLRLIYSRCPDVLKPNPSPR